MRILKGAVEVIGSIAALIAVVIAYACCVASKDADDAAERMFRDRHDLSGQCSDDQG